MRIAWTMGWGVVAVLLIALWVRSYKVLDRIEWLHNRTHLSLISFHGQVGNTWFGYSHSMPRESWGTKFYSFTIQKGTQVNYNDGTGHPLPSYLGFKSSWLSSPVRRAASILVIPYWFPTLSFGIIAAVPWLCCVRWLFSLRTLLIATTLVAVVLGMIVALR